MDCISCCASLVSNHSTTNVTFTYSHTDGRCCYQRCFLRGNHLKQMPLFYPKCQLSANSKPNSYCCTDVSIQLIHDDFNRFHVNADGLLISLEEGHADASDYQERWGYSNIRQVFWWDELKMSLHTWWSHYRSWCPETKKKKCFKAYFGSKSPNFEIEVLALSSFIWIRGLV